MLNVQKVQNSNPTRFILSGTIDETTEFAELFGRDVAPKEFVCRGVTRINSIGIKLWCDYFHELRAKGGNFKFLEVAPALVAALNHVSDFVATNEIQSICVPYFCSHCNTPVLRPYDKIAAATLLTNATPLPCETCGNPTDVDEILEDFLAFL